MGSLVHSNFKLNNGNDIPAIAYGTKRFKDENLGDVDSELVQSVEKAIDAGFRHIDGAEIYGANTEIGLAIKKSKVPREQLFITDKFFSGNPDFTIKPKHDNPYQALKSDLKELELDYVDLYLLHFPYIKKETHGYSLVEAWQYLEKLKDDGLTKNIGVSNFTIKDLKEILDSNPRYTPSVNQIEFSPYLQNQSPGIVQYSKEQGISIEGYGSLTPIVKEGQGPLDPLLENLAQKYNKNRDQILLRWVLQQGVLPVTTSAKDQRIKSYLEIFDFELSQDDADQITQIGKQNTVRRYEPKHSEHDN